MDCRSGRVAQNFHKERRAKAARRTSRFIYPKTAARGLHQSRSAHKNQNPQNGHLMARFDWGLGAVCFGASPVAAVFGSAPGSATPPGHRLHFTKGGKIIGFPVTFSNDPTSNPTVTF